MLKWIFIYVLLNVKATLKRLRKNSNYFKLKKSRHSYSNSKTRTQVKTMIQSHCFSFIFYLMSFYTVSKGSHYDD